MRDVLPDIAGARLIRPARSPRERGTGGAVPVAVIDGPFDGAALSSVLARPPVGIDRGSCDGGPNPACDHGTFVMGLLGARHDAVLPGLCPDSPLIHIPLFADGDRPAASVDALAAAIDNAVEAGARLINLSLAILGDDAQVHPRLARALDAADAHGALLVVAAGNQGRPAAGQLLSHPAVIPVVAADVSQRLLPDSNFGPLIARRGVATLGRMPGYAPGGGTTVMSGTSVAAAVATGILAQVWAERPESDADALRAAVAALGPRDGAKPPVLDRDRVVSELDRAAAAQASAASHVTQLQGATGMTTGNGRRFPSAAAGSFARSRQLVRPAGSGCGCGAPDGACSCGGDHDEPSGFVYAIGTVEADYPNIAIEREMQAMAMHFNVPSEPDEDARRGITESARWQQRILRNRPELRYLARQLRWRLTIEDFPVFLLTPADPSYYDQLIDALYPLDEDEGDNRGRKRAAKPKPAKKRAGLKNDLDVVVGLMGARTPEGTEVVVDQIFQIDDDQLNPGGMKYYSQLADNHGLTDSDRAYNYLVARYRPKFEEAGVVEDKLKAGAVEDKLKQAEFDGYKFTGMRVTPSRLGTGIGRIVRAIYTFRNNKGLEQEYFVRVDVTHEFPMIVSPWEPYLERERGGA